MLTVVVGVGAADRGEGLSSFAWRRVFSFFIFARAFFCNVRQVKGTFSREFICASPFWGGYEAWHCFEVQTKLMIVSLKTMTIFLWWWWTDGGFSWRFEVSLLLIVGWKHHLAALPSYCWKHHLADVGGDLGDCEGARSCWAWSVGARVPRVNILLQIFPIIFFYPGLRIYVVFVETVSPQVLVDTIQQTPGSRCWLT